MPAPHNISESPHLAKIMWVLMGMVAEKIDGHIVEHKQIFLGSLRGLWLLREGGRGGGGVVYENL